MGFLRITKISSSFEESFLFHICLFSKLPMDYKVIFNSTEKGHWIRTIADNAKIVAGSGDNIIFDVCNVDNDNIEKIEPVHLVILA